MLVILLLLLVLFLCISDISYGQNYPNIENQMLSNSLNSFLYYESKDPVPFSDPRSLVDTENRARESDLYHDSLYHQPSHYSHNNNSPNNPASNYQFNVVNVINITTINKRYTNPYRFRIP
jgi:hypothetical protein